MRWYSIRIDNPKIAYNLLCSIIICRYRIPAAYNAVSVKQPTIADNTIS